MKKARFNSLTSNGPIFPDKWVNKGYKLAGKQLSDLAEEMIWKGARFLGSDYEKEAYDPKSNMWICLFPELDKSQTDKQLILSLMQTMKKAQESAKEEKKLLTKDEKLAIKEIKDQQKEEYGHAILDGQKVPLSGYMIEDSNWILTRGKDPRKFSWKYAVEPKDVIINIVGDKAKAAELKKKGFQIDSDNTVIWVMRYKISCGRESMSSHMKLNKQIAFAPSVSVRQKNNSGKFDKSKNILANWPKIQTKIKTDCLKGKDDALIVYLIQETGIRIGGERDEKRKAMTYGMATLEGQHIVCNQPNNTVSFNFLGKDSVPETRTISIDPAVWNVLAKKLHGTKGKRIFNAIDVNGYLKSIMPGITVKNLRTVVCNEVLINNLKAKKISKNNTEAEKLRALFEANLEIAKTMNHQKNIGKNQKEGEAKIAERIAKTKLRVKELKKRHKEKLAKLDAQAEKYKDIYKGLKLLKEKLAIIAEQKSKMETQMGRALISVEKTEFALDKKKMTADIALGTSLANYADPNVIYSFCKDIELPIERVYSASQRKNLTFAENVDPSYWRTYPS